MVDSMDNAVLAIDGGGTRCRVALARDEMRHVVETGPANATSDLDQAVGAVVDGLRGLSRALGVPFEALCALPAFVGLAGATGPVITAQLSDALPLARAEIGDDRRAALRGALGDGDGVLAHCGTGSFFARQSGGAAHLAGGWGPILGDEASAMFIGRTALALTLRASDGTGAASGLTKALLDRFESTDGILRFAATASAPDFGAFAPAVTDAAATGDCVARQIMQGGAGSIATALEAIGWKRGMPICLTGGVGPLFAGYLPADIQAALIEPIGTPLDGAIALAREFSQEPAYGHY